MIVLATALVALLGFVVVVAFLRSEKARSARVLVIALTDEDEGRYESACYHYAIALNAGAAAELCEPKIVQLWRHHGPFTFGEAGAALRDRYCSHAVSCGQGIHALTVSDIRRIVDTASGGGHAGPHE